MLYQYSGGYGAALSHAGYRGSTSSRAAGTVVRVKPNTYTVYYIVVRVKSDTPTLTKSDILHLYFFYIYKINGFFGNYLTISNISIVS